MSYATLREQEGVKQNYLVVISPRRHVQTWTLTTDFIYTADWGGFPKPRLLEFDGEEMTEVDTPVVNASEWYWDEDTDTLYFRTPESADPDTGMTTVEYELYLSRFDEYWHRVPTNTATTTVYFFGAVKSNPQIKASMSDSLFGYLPTLSSSIKLINAEHWLEKHVYDSSFSKGAIKIYHALGDSPSASNIKLIYDGFMGDVEYSNDEVSIKTVDRLDEFETEFRPPTTSFYNIDTFPTHVFDPGSLNQPVRYVYGRVEGFQPANGGFEDIIPSMFDNRVWFVCNEITGIDEVSRTVGASSTLSRTYVDFTEGLNIGDTLWMDRASGTDEYTTITAVSRSPAYIEHPDLAAAMDPGDLVKRGFVSAVYVVQNGIKYPLLYKRDYTVEIDREASSSAIILADEFELEVGMPDPLNPYDQVSCTVYGRVNDLTAGGPTFGANDPETNNLANPVMVLYDLMKNRLGIPESEINLTSFAAVRTATASEGIRLAIPDTATGEFPSMKDLMSSILETSLLRIFLDDDSKWSISQLAPYTTADDSVTDEELLGEVKHTFEYGDVVSDVIVEYNAREIPDLIGAAGPQVSRVTAESNIARHLHKINKSHTVSSLHMREDDAQTLADRLAFTLGDRKGKIEISVPTRFLDSLIGDTISISRPALPGFDFEPDTDQSRSAVVIGVTKDTKKVSFELDDQKGIQDNESDW